MSPDEVTDSRGQLPLSQTEHELAQLIANARRNLTLREKYRRHGMPWPPKDNVRFHIITRRRNTKKATNA